LLLSAPAEHWRQALDLALGCGLRPQLRTPLVAAARTRLQQRLSDADDLLAEAAYLAAPTRPGALAPLGHRERASNVTRADLADLWAASARGGALSVGVVGPVEIAEAARSAAHRMAVLEAGVLEIAEETASAPAAALTREPAERYSEALAVWRSASANESASGAEAFAAWMRASLNALPEVSARWHAGGAPDEGAFAAVLISAPPAKLSALQGMLSAVTAGPMPSQLARAAGAAAAQARRRNAQRAGTAASIAESLAAAPFRAPHDRAAVAPADETAKRLWHSSAIWRPIR
jgi:hypothetical protein